MCNRQKFKWGMHNKSDGRLYAVTDVWCSDIILHDGYTYIRS